MHWPNKWRYNDAGADSQHGLTAATIVSLDTDIFAVDTDCCHRQYHTREPVLSHCFPSLYPYVLCLAPFPDYQRVHHSTLVTPASHCYPCFNAVHGSVKWIHCRYERSVVVTNNCPSRKYNNRGANGHATECPEPVVVQVIVRDEAGSGFEEGLMCVETITVQHHD